jgi:GH25 family lysozyme M1 (1,4-beta-N-acetylmuramidase)
MKPNTCLVIDVWEGQLEIDEAVLKANGVAGIAIRINDMSGGHHNDQNFLKQWEQAKGFVRFPYFVYNPWVSAQENFDWLIKNLPSEVKVVAVDVEVKYSGITTAKYAIDVAKFLSLCQTKGLKTIVYTAEWFLANLKAWPKNVDYWWAQYPTPSQFSTGPNISWDDLRTGLNRLDKPFNAKVIPGPLKMWQFSGDYFVLPGSNRNIDVNIFYGTVDELSSYFSESEPTTTIPTTDPDLVLFDKPKKAKILVAALKIRVGAGLQFNQEGMLKAGDVITVYGEKKDFYGVVWGKLYDNYWACRYMPKQESFYVYMDEVLVPDLTFPAMYRIKDDLEAGVPQRPYIRDQLPSTVRIRGGATSLLLTPAWMEYVYKIQNKPNYQFISPTHLGDNVGWHNNGEPNKVEQLTFSGNIVEVLRIEGRKAFITVQHLEDGPPVTITKPTPTKLNSTIHLFTTQYDHIRDTSKPYNQGLDITTNGKFPRIVLLANPGEELWIDIGDLVRL